MLALLVAVTSGQACELCRAAYFAALEAAPKASKQHPDARVVTYTLDIGASELSPAGKPVQVLTINGTSPGPVLRFREGDVARITVRNTLRSEDASIHWHGLLVPNLEDGVPLLTTPPIGPGQSRVFEFLIRQNGTYWYHSHTAHQEQRGIYGAIVIEPRQATNLKTDHDQAIVLSDWTNEDPNEVQRTLQRGSDWYALRKGAAQSLFGAWQAGHLGEYLDREKALVPPMDFGDVAYDAFLMNGQRRLQLPGRPGETIRVRLINAGAATYFYLDAATGPLRIIAADGQDVKALETKRLLIGPAECYDILVTIPRAGTWELRATAQDGSGAVSAWLGAGETHAAVGPPKPNPYGMSDYLMSILDQLDPEPGVQSFDRPLSPYASLRAAQPQAVPASAREVTLKLSGDMVRYVWSFDGISAEEAGPIKVRRDETIRVKLVNNTMMHHPIHFHGHFFRLVTPEEDDPSTAPLKHTVDVPPMSTRLIEFTANEGDGDWLLHCHLLYHHVSGMMRVIRVTGPAGEEPPHEPMLHEKESRFAWGEATLTSAFHQASATLRQGNHDVTLDWLQGARAGDGHEGLLAYRHYVSQRWTWFAGYRVDTMMGGDKGLVAGATYRLPYFIDVTFSQQSGGESRLALAKSLQLSDRLSLHLSLQHGRHTGTAGGAMLNCTLTKETSLSLGYSSEFGTGGGLTFRF
ncbi:MAG: hypothetical protein RLZ70_982 [Verrucomicrobiota bacterium]|jgi:FtsP/CotA-like multicopper oxidase with cupredoxin domain